MPNETYHNPTETSTSNSTWDQLGEEVPFQTETPPQATETTPQNSEDRNHAPAFNNLEKLLQGNPELDAKLSTLAIDYAGRMQPEEKSNVLACIWQAEQLTRIQQNTSLYGQLQTMSEYYPEYLETKELFEDVAVAETIKAAENPYVGIAEGFILRTQLENNNQALPETEQRKNQALIQCAEQYINDQAYKPSEPTGGISMGLWAYLHKERAHLEQSFIGATNDNETITINSDDFLKYQALNQQNLRKKFLQLQTSCDDKLPEDFMRNYL